MNILVFIVIFASIVGKALPFIAKGINSEKNSGEKPSDFSNEIKDIFASSDKKSFQRISAEDDHLEYENASSDRSSKPIKELASFFGEDRNSDWMSKQLKEETRVKRNTLDLGASHDKDCDAEDLKRFHRLFEHSDRIDTGERN